MITKHTHETKSTASSFFAALTYSYGAVLKKEIAVDTTLIYQEGNFEYDVNLSQLGVFEFERCTPIRIYRV